MLSLPLSHIVGLALGLFLIGLVGLLTRRNLLMILVGVEIMLNGVALLLVAAGARWGQPEATLMVLVLLVIAAVEVGIGLALFLKVQHQNHTLDPDELRELGA